MLDGWKHERRIRKMLRALARQRVTGFDEIKMGWIVDRPFPNDDDALRNCHARGWVEILSIRGNASAFDGKTQQGRFQLYRLTDSGWNALQRTHVWLVQTFLVAFATLVATLIGIIVMVLIR